MKAFKYSWLVVLTIMALLITACGGDAATATTGAPTTGPSDATAMVATATIGGAATADSGAGSAPPPLLRGGPTNTTAPSGAALTATIEPTPVSLGSSSAKTTITIWHGWGGAYLAAKQAIFAQYVAAHPDVAIKLLQVSDIGTKAQNAVPAGVGPDIIAWVDDNIGQNVLTGVIDTLDDKGVDNAYLTANFPKVAVDAMTYDGHIYGLPETLEAITMFYNKKLITADKLPKTTTELASMMKSYSAANAGSYLAVWNPNDAYFNAPWFYGAGAQYVTPDGTAHLDSSQALATAQWLRSLQGSMPKDIDGNVADALFNDGKAAAEITGPWRVADLQKAGMDFGLAKLPAVDFGDKGPARPFVGVKTLMLAKGSKHSDVAIDIMKFYTSKDNQETMVKATGEVPANSAAAADLASDPLISGFGAQATDGVPLPNTPFMGAMWDPVGKALTAIWSGSDDPQKIMTDSQAAATSALAKMK